MPLVMLVRAFSHICSLATIKNKPFIAALKALSSGVLTGYKHM